jgi:hypothetical protein
MLRPSPFLFLTGPGRKVLLLPPEMCAPRPLSSCEDDERPNQTPPDDDDDDRWCRAENPAAEEETRGVVGVESRPVGSVCRRTAHGTNNARPPLNPPPFFSFFRVGRESTKYRL